MFNLMMKEYKWKEKVNRGSFSTLKWKSEEVRRYRSYFLFHFLIYYEVMNLPNLEIKVEVGI